MRICRKCKFPFNAIFFYLYRMSQVIPSSTVRKIKKFYAPSDYKPDIEEKINEWMAKEAPKNVEFHFINSALAFVVYDEGGPQVL